VAWTTPFTAVVGTPIRASDWNTAGRDNLLASPTALVTTAGDTVYATGATAMARLGIGTSRQPLRTNAGATAPEWFTPPACRVYHNAAQSINNATTTALAFNSERFDTEAMHDTSINNSRITIVTPGVYLLTATVFFAGTAAGEYDAEFRVNGSTYIAYENDRWPTGGSISPGFAIATVYKLAANDYVEVTVAQNTGGAVNVQSIGNYTPEFAAAWLGPG
jgi:hypothetical protein